MTQQNCFKLPACQPAQDSLCPIASSHCMRKPQPLMRCSPECCALHTPSRDTPVPRHMIEKVSCVCTPSTIFPFFLIRPAPTDGHSNECINFFFRFRSSVWSGAATTGSDGMDAPERHPRESQASTHQMDSGTCLRKLQIFRSGIELCIVIVWSTGYATTPRSTALAYHRARFK